MEYPIKNIPSVEKTEFKQRTISSSEQLNQNEKQVFNDILDLFNKANLIQKEMHELNMAATIENTNYEKRLQEATIQIAQLQDQYNNLLLAKEDMRYLTKFAHEAMVDSLNPFAASLDVTTCDITASITSSTSKLRVYDETYDEVLIPPSLKAFIGPDSFQTNEHILSIEDNNLSNCLDGNEGSVWFRKVITDHTIDRIENEIVLGLPEDIVTSRLLNQIVLYPYPCGSLDILDVQYRNNGQWTTIPGFSYHHGYETEEIVDAFQNKLTRGCINYATNLKFNFDAIQTNQIKIKFRQREYGIDETNNRRTFYLGLRNIDINYNRYTKKHSEFFMDFNFPELEQNIKIYDTKIILNNMATANIFKEYYYFDEDGNTHRITDSIPFILKGHKVRVKFTMEGAMETPNIYKCQIDYKLS